MIARPVCAPNVVANDDARPTASPTMIDATLSRPTPPSSSGTSVPRRPSSPARFMSLRASAQSFCSSCSMRGHDLVVDELLGRPGDQAMLVAETVRA